MRAIQIDRFGTPDVLRVADVPEPGPDTGDVLIRAVATSINPVDDKTREGLFGDGIPPAPITLGWDLAGIVVDGGGSGLRPGERVVAMSHQLGSGRGTWADLVALPAHAVALAPRDVSLAEAVTLPLPGLTAWQTWTGSRSSPASGRWSPGRPARSAGWRCRSPGRVVCGSTPWSPGRRSPPSPASTVPAWSPPTPTPCGAATTTRSSTPSARSSPTRWRTAAGTRPSPPRPARCPTCRRAACAPPSTRYARTAPHCAGSPNWSTAAR
ncbi:protein of unknown function (plasmid) [Streptantibioticus cattleyicolor NRRL 8057 = DSM 46488]|nr:protein of unknown function [Streptantibioticus cattleyicolor NRRL 8057 = DSM 46488]